MNVGLLLITHGNLGEELLHTATAMLGHCPLSAKALAVHMDSDPDQVLQAAIRACRSLDKGEGVLIFTDLYGSTPSNIANRLRDTCKVEVVTGVNIPMLVRALNYPDLNLEQLCIKATSGGRDGVFTCNGTPEN